MSRQLMAAATRMLTVCNCVRCASWPSAQCVCCLSAGAPLFSNVPFTALPPAQASALQDQRSEEIESLVAIFGDDHVTVDGTGAVYVKVDLQIDDKFTAGVPMGAVLF